MTNLGLVSVPSRGLSYLNVKKAQEKDSLGYVSVPSRGLSYLNLLKANHPDNGGDGFRPLTGTLLSKHHPPILPPQAAFFAGLRGK